jgi:hypothetical protein
LLDGVTGALSHVADVGKNLSKAAESFGRFASSTNRYVLGRARKLAALGLDPSKPLPSNLPVFQVTALDTVIDGESAEVHELDAARKPRLIAE